MDSRNNRKQIKEQYGIVFNTLSEILFRHDPIGINFGDNTDEYDPEVGTILPRLETATTEDQVLQIIHEEFIKWFDADLVGSKEKYQALARDVWEMWRRLKENYK
ncbi:hypothetical protein cce_2329 [Crocosphaera subtropica ATCC 51142]|uniref:Uncharacterized protein n=1 Tax=Crocosphaera subtropica (strain ATCC 51142 / BH68) TaxID=43989 RepID=B1WQG8_CROS5|nr:hypothetical protein [Crocosphaera subtropica]ACB51679.1 hypothetical protein cce_2329 [Crocosphaera subtropica ATCC 51142]